MNARQSVAGFDFARYNRDFLARAQPAGNGQGSNGQSGNQDHSVGNDAERYGVRVIPAQVEPGQFYWRVIGVHHLEPTENKGKHNLFAELLDEEGKRIRDANVQLARGWEGQRPDETAPLVRFDKGDNEPATNLPIDRNQKLWVRVASDLPSDTVENLHTKHADEPGPNGELWNSIGHHSFYVVFQRTRKQAVTVPPITEPGDTHPRPMPSDDALFDDATYLDGNDAVPPLTVVQPGQRFTQSWRVLNSGSRAWGEDYRVVLASGVTLDAPSHVLTRPCPPGEAITVSVPFTAPTQPGPLHSVWRMANGRGEAFGERLWLVVVVANTREAREADDAGQPAARNVRPVTTPTEPPGRPTPRLPEITATKSGDASTPGTPSAVRDPELYAAWKTHIENGFANNQQMFEQLLNGFMNPYWTTVWMYRILFGLGVASFLVAAGLSAFSDKEGYTLVFGGLSALSLLAYFFNRPLQALEENLHFITWLGLIYNSYWTRLVYLNSQPDVQKELQDATDDAIRRIMKLMDTHAKRASKRQSLSE